MDPLAIFDVIEKLHDLSDEIVTRIENYGGHSDGVNVTRSCISASKGKLSLLKEILKDTTVVQHPAFLSNLESRLKGFKSEIDDIDAKEKLLSEQIHPNPKPHLFQRLKRNFEQFFRANELAYKISEFLKRLENVSKELCDLMSELNNHYVSLPKQDKFKPNFETAPLLQGKRLVLDFEDERSSEGKLLKTLLEQCKGSRNSVTAATGAPETGGAPSETGVTGLGGVGKTSALIGLCHNKRVQAHFEDGVYYASIGKDASEDDVFNHLSNIIKASGGVKCAEETQKEKLLSSAIRKTAEWFKNRTVLFVIDDLWATTLCETGYLGEFMNVSAWSGKGHLVISTRQRSLVADLGESVEFDTLDEEKSLKLLCTYAEISDEMRKEASDEDRSSIINMTKHCEGLPLTLAIAGRHIRNKKNWGWSRAVDHLIHNFKDALHTKPLAGYHSLTKVIKASIDMMKEDINSSDDPIYAQVDISELFRRLCIFPKQARLSVGVICKAWKMENANAAEKILNKIFDYCIVMKEERDDSWVYGMHDLVLDYARCMSERCGEYAVYHCDFLSQHASPVFERKSIRGEEGRSCTSIVRRTEGVRRWWDVKWEDGGYMSSNLARHMVEAGRSDELIELLSDARWIRRRVEDGSIVIAREEYETLLLHLRTVKEIVGDVEENIMRDMRWVRNFISHYWTYMVDDTAQLASVIHETFLNLPETSKVVERIVRTARLVAPQAWFRPIWRCRPLPSSGKEFIHQAGAPVQALVVDWKNDLVAFSDDEGDLYCLDTVTRKLFELKVGRDVDYLALSKDGSTLVCGSTMEGISITDCEELVELMKSALREGRSTVDDIGSSSAEPSLDLRGISKHYSLRGSHTLYSVAVSGDGSRVLSVLQDGALTLWDVKRGKQVGEAMIGPSDHVKVAAISGDGKIAVSGSTDSTVRMWDVESGKQVGEPMFGHSDEVNCVAISRDGRRVVSGSSDRTVRVWDVESGKQVGEAMIGHSDDVNVVVISEDGKIVVSGSDDGTVRMWDVESGKQIGYPMTGHSDDILSVAISGDGWRLVSGSRDETIRMWDVESRRDVDEPMIDHLDRVNSVAISGDGKIVVSGSDDGTVRMWDVESGKQFCEPMIGHSDSVRSVAISCDGKIVAAGSSLSVRLWRCESGKLICEVSFRHSRRGTGGRTEVEDYFDYRNFCGSVAISGDGKVVVLGCTDGAVRMWDVESGKQVGELIANTEYVDCVAISGDGKTVVSGSDGTVRMWDAESGKSVSEFMIGYSHDVSSVAISGDGKRLVSGSEDGTVRMWDVESGKQVGEAMIANSGAVWSLALSGDGKRIVASGSEDKTVRIWDVDREGS